MKPTIKYHLDCLLISIPVLLISAFVLFKLFGVDIPEPDLTVYKGTTAYITDFLDNPSFESIYENKYSNPVVQQQAEHMTKIALLKSILTSLPIAILTHFIVYKKAYTE